MPTEWILELPRFGGHVVQAAISWAPDLANAGISAGRGDLTGAGLSMAAAIPLLGNAANATRLGRSVAKGVDKAHDASKAAKAAPKLLDPGTRIGAKIDKQMAKRGWNREAVDKLIANPHQTRTVRDTRHLPGGTRMDDLATVDINRQGHYVIRNDRTGDIVQVSNRHDVDWVVPWN